MENTSKRRIKLVKRMSAVAELEKTWDQMSLLYGNRISQTLRELAPADPTILRDYAITKFIMDGKSRKEANGLIEKYTETEWAECMEQFTPILKRSKDVYLNEWRKHNHV